MKSLIKFDVPLRWQSVTLNELNVARKVDILEEAENCPLNKFIKVCTQGLLPDKMYTVSLDSLMYGAK